MIFDGVSDFAINKVASYALSLYVFFLMFPMFMM